MLIGILAYLAFIVLVCWAGFQSTRNRETFLRTHPDTNTDVEC